MELYVYILTFKLSLLLMFYSITEQRETIDPIFTYKEIVEQIKAY